MLSFHCRKLKKEQQIKFKVTRRDEIITIRAGINEIERELTENQGNQKLIL